MAAEGLAGPPRVGTRARKRLESGTPRQRTKSQYARRMFCSADASARRPAPDLRLSAPAVLVLDRFRLMTSAAAQRLSLGTQRLVAFVFAAGFALNAEKREVAAAGAPSV